MVLTYSKGLILQSRRENSEAADEIERPLDFHEDRLRRYLHGQRERLLSVREWRRGPVHAGSHGIVDLQRRLEIRLKTGNGG